ncbi:MAG TPA: S-layer homology domain-containing protein [bacterium]|nr:S-layer homology domain-containing protein [bacterium]
MLPRTKVSLGFMLAVIMVIISPPATAKDLNLTPPLPAVLDIGARAIISETDSQLTANYKELILITGEPVLAAGTVEIRKGKPRNNQMNTTYSYDLENKQHGLKLNRRLTVVTTWEQRGKELTAKNEVSRFTETVRTESRQYKLDSKRSLLNFSTVTMAEPAVSYFAGNLEGCKVYTVGRNEGQVVVDITGDSTGYDQPWGQVEIQNSYGTIRSELVDAEGTVISWDGTFNSQVSHSTKVDLQYVANEPVQISFPGGYLQTETSEGVIRVNYDLPRPDEEGVPLGSRRQQKQETINLTGTPKTQRLSVPQFSDIQGRWSEQDAILLGSLGAWKGESKYFHPTASVDRREFALAMAKALRLKPQEATTSRTNFSRRNQELPSSPYRDLSVEDEDWPYLKVVTESGIMQGIAPGYFGPQGKVTRAQAVTAFIRALGFENLGPGTGYQTGFTDDGDIPSWARNNFAVGRQIGIVSGDGFGRARPGAYLTREEAATMLARLVAYLRSDILRDYRDRILLYH